MPPPRIQHGWQQARDSFRPCHRGACAALCGGRRCCSARPELRQITGSGGTRSWCLWLPAPAPAAAGTRNRAVIVVTRLEQSLRSRQRLRQQLVLTHEGPNLRQGYTREGDESMHARVMQRQKEQTGRSLGHTRATSSSRRFSVSRSSCTSRVNCLIT